MFYKNARIFCRDFQFHTGAFEVKEDGTFGSVLPDTVPEDAIDLGGATVIPGLCDVHTHGNSNYDFSDGSYEGMVTMARYWAKEGITSFAVTTTTMPYEVLDKALMTGLRLTKEQPEGCGRLMGIHLEGPYISHSKKGAQNPAYLKDPDFEGFKKLYDHCEGLIRIVDVAPELPGAKEFIEQASKLCRVGFVHTDATYQETKMGIEAGATHLSHMFNGMRSIHHREPGAIPAGLEAPQVRAEIVGDGLHIHPAVVYMAFKMFGPDRIMIISDTLRACGMPDGIYDAAGQISIIKDGIARLENGQIAGSITNLYECIRRVMTFGVPEEDVIRAATYTPACALNVQDKIGSIEEGKLADFIVCRNNYAEKAVYLGGKRL
jgi:N-acetylglucosamine-6-phosphate deacetylase